MLGAETILNSSGYNFIFKESVMIYEKPVIVIYLSEKKPDCPDKIYLMPLHEDIICHLSMFCFAFVLTFLFSRPQVFVLRI